MQIATPKLFKEIPPVRKARSDTDLRQFITGDMAKMLEGGSAWVRETAFAAEAQILAAGNPTDRVIEVNGVNGKGFHAGTITDARNSVRIQWVGDDLGQLANRMTQILLGVIWQTFPKMKRKRLTRWSWYRFENGLLDTKAGRGGGAQRLGTSVPSGSIGIYDVLILAPDEVAAEFAWFANRTTKKSAGYKFNSYTRKRKGQMETKLRKRLRGFLAEAAQRMRSVSRNSPGITVQGVIVGRGLTSSASRAVRVGSMPHALPVIRLAYKRGLARSIQV